MVYVSDFLYSKSVDPPRSYSTNRAPAAVAGDKPRYINLLPFKPVCHYLKRSKGRLAWANDTGIPYQHTAPQRHYEVLWPSLIFGADHYDWKNQIWTFRTGMLRFWIAGVALGFMSWYVRMSRNGWEIKNPTVTQGIVFDDE